MWYLVQSNQLECLFARLAAVLAAPLEDPLAPEVIVVQNAGMARWLSQRIALHAGIAANIQFPLPARFIWQVLAGQLTLPRIGVILTARFCAGVFFRCSPKAGSWQITRSRPCTCGMTRTVARLCNWRKRWPTSLISIWCTARTCFWPGSPAKKAAGRRNSGACFRRGVGRTGQACCSCFGTGLAPGG